MTAPTVVLVHGAFAESASWSGVIAALQSRGVNAIATPNPLRSVTTDAANVRSAVESIGGPVLLVGHSYGGAVITEAAVGSDAVTGLVYVAAFAPDHGETALGLTGQFPGSTLGETVRPYPLGDGTNDLIVDRELFPNQFAGDVPARGRQDRRRDPAPHPRLRPRRAAARRDAGVEDPAVVVRLRHRRQEHPRRRPALHGRARRFAQDRRDRGSVALGDGLEPRRRRRPDPGRARPPVLIRT